MIRISGVNIPATKKTHIALTYIYGIGNFIAKKICRIVNISYNIKITNLSEEQIKNIRAAIDSNYTVEGDLRIQTALNIKNLIDTKSYRGMRHVKKLPVRGQRTHTNARTKKRKVNY